VSGIPDKTSAGNIYKASRRKEEIYMSANNVHQKINLVELALNNAGTPQTLNAIIDTLKEIERTLEALENSVSRGLSQQSKPGDENGFS
jgi:hypothetical protein